MGAFGVNYLPPAPIQDQTEKAQRLMQMGLALQNQKKQDAWKTLEGGFKLMDMGIDPDYNKMTKAAKEAGFPLPSDPAQWGATRQAFESQQQTDTSGATPTPGVNPNQAAKTGRVTQGNQAGAQAGTPPSRGAAQQRPGGGMVNPSGSPQASTLQKAVAGNLKPGNTGIPTPAVDEALNAITNARQTTAGGPAPTPGAPAQPAQPAPQMEGAATPSNQNPLAGYTAARREAANIAAMTGAAEAQKQMAVSTLARKIANSDPSDINFKDIGKYNALTGQGMSLDYAKFAAMDTNQRGHYLNIAAGMEEANDTKQQRITTAKVNLINGGKLSEIVASPDDYDDYAEAIASGNTVPAGITQKTNLNRVLQEQDLVTKYAAIVPLKTARQMAALAINGGDPLDAIPDDGTGQVKSLVEQTLDLETRKTTAMELQADSSWLQAQATMLGAEAALTQAQAKSLTDPKLAESLATLQGFANADKLGLDVDEDLVRAALNDIAARSGWSEEQTKGVFSRFWGFLFGSTEMKRPGPPQGSLQGAIGGTGAKPNAQPKSSPEDIEWMKQHGYSDAQIKAAQRGQ
jgi:hypothetical protein